MSNRGYTDGELGVAYINNFNDQTVEKANTVQFLFVDGHNSHCTLEALNFAAEHNIVIISYPPHTTHALQGLDVACFGPLKIFSKFIQRLAGLHLRNPQLYQHFVLLDLFPNGEFGIPLPTPARKIVMAHRNYNTITQRNP